MAWVETGQRAGYFPGSSDADVPPGSYLAGPTGSTGFTRADGFDDGAISKEARDAALAARLWERSRELVGV